ncbi:MAG: hypothetical protein ACKO96_14875 [Flammeovirgaceae bacterium]
MFEGSKQEILNNEVERAKIETLAAIETKIIVGKFHISGSGYFAKEMAKKSRSKGNEDFALQFDQMAVNLTLSYAALDECDKERRISRQRAADLEIQILHADRKIEQMQRLINEMQQQIDRYGL